MLKEKVTVNCLLSLSFLAAIFFIVSCGSFNSNSGSTSGSDSVSSLDQEREFDKNFKELNGIDFIPPNTYTPAPVAQSKDPNVKYKTLVWGWDIDADTDSAQDQDKDLRVSNISPSFRILGSGPKAQIGMINKSSFDEVTRDDVKNANLFNGGVRIETDIVEEKMSDNLNPSLGTWFLKALGVDKKLDDLPKAALVKYKFEMGPGAYQILKQGSLLAIQTNNYKYVKAQVIGWEPLKDGGAVIEKWNIKLQYVIYPEPMSSEERKAAEIKTEARRKAFEKNMAEVTAKKEKKAAEIAEEKLVTINMGSATIPIEKLYKEGLYVAWLKKQQGIAAGGNVNTCAFQLSVTDGKKLSFYMPDASDYQILYHKDSHIMLFLFETTDDKTKDLTFYSLKVKPSFKTKTWNPYYQVEDKPREIIDSFVVTEMQTKSVSCQDQAAMQKLLQEIIKQSFTGSGSDVYDDDSISYNFYIIVNKIISADSGSQKKL